MSDRTPQQRAADEALGEAIKQALTAYGSTYEYLLVDYVVLTAETRFDENGKQYTMYNRFYQDGCMPWYRILGLIDIHRSLSHAEATGVTSD